MIHEILVLALSLLMAAQQPEVPESLRIQATNTALYAIEIAQNELKTTPVAQTTEMKVGATTTPAKAISEQKGTTWSGKTWTAADGCQYGVLSSGQKTWQKISC